MRYLCPVILALALAGCGKTIDSQLRDVQPPQIVTKVVEKRVDLPTWATEQLPNVAPADKSLKALVKANNARADTVDYANCRSRLIEKVQRGEKVDPKDCRK
jgi:hypothetical protein